MKKYALFRFYTFYPCGGIDDFYGFFDTVEECKADGEAHDWENAQIVDTGTWDCVEVWHSGKWIVIE